MNIYFFKFRCHGIQIQNGQASCRKPHSRLTGKAVSPGKRQTAAKSAVYFILIYCYSYNKILIKKSILFSCN